MRPAELRMELNAAIMSTGLVIPVDGGMEKTTRSSTLWVLCKQVPGGEKGWLAIVDALLFAAENSVHACRRYVRKNDRMVFGWYLSFTAPSKKLPSIIEAVVAILNEVKPTLTAASEERYQPTPQEPEATGSVRDYIPEGARVPSGPMARVAPPPPAFNPNPRVVLRKIDEHTGKIHEETEMPLPFIYREMNKPTPGGRGAKPLAGGR
jgi:hypothetical protein